MNPPTRRLDFFERYLTVWVFVCMIVGVGVGMIFPGVTRALGQLEFGTDSHVNIPIAVAGQFARSGEAKIPVCVALNRAAGFSPESSDPIHDASSQ